MLLVRALLVGAAAAAVAAAAAAAQLRNLRPVSFDEGRSVGPVPQLTEASGLALSHVHKDVIYSHDDDGDAVLYAINSTSGEVLARMPVQGAINHDWEDIAVGPCGADSCIYIADTGDKNSKSARNVIYRVIDATASFQYEYDDCDTAMVDPQGAVWLLPKVKSNPKLFKIEAIHFGGPQVNIAGTGSNANVFLGGKSGPTGGDISRDGTQILIRAPYGTGRKTLKQVASYGDPDLTKVGVWHYQLQSGEADIRAALERLPIKVSVQNEPQGEAVCWNAAGDGYYTLSEGAMQPLYYYRSNAPTDIIG